MSKIIAINAGSSSLKFQLFQMPEENVIAKGLVERIGLKESSISIKFDGIVNEEVTDIPNHEVAVEILLNQLTGLGIIKSLNEIEGVGHRVVHGGESFPDSIIVTEDVIEKIEELSDLAPLHNPANIIGIKSFLSVLPNVPAVTVFDTAFHQTMPKSAYLYSVPYEYYEKYGVRKYGFHGTSHKYVSQRAADLLNKQVEDLKIVSCHIGNGASIAAIDGGKSVDTSMGFTPLAGITMGTRSGNLDPALIPFIMSKEGKTAEEVLQILNKESGLLGLSQFSSDLRDIKDAAAGGNEQAELALEVFTKRIHKYIGSYAATMNGVDAVVFTAGIGENSDIVRARVLEGLAFLGIQWDPSLNTHANGKEQIISTPDSRVKVLVIPTDEEVMIARDVVRLTH